MDGLFWLILIGFLSQNSLIQILLALSSQRGILMVFILVLIGIFMVL